MVLVLLHRQASRHVQPLRAAYLQKGLMHCVFQVVKLKDEYISNLESSTSIDESEERPHMNPSLKAALWCATASLCISTSSDQKSFSANHLSIHSLQYPHAFTSLILPPAAVQGQQEAVSQSGLCMVGSKILHLLLQQILCHSAQ